jgi:hypothetical protein
MPRQPVHFFDLYDIHQLKLPAIKSASLRLIATSHTLMRISKTLTAEAEKNVIKTRELVGKIARR